MVRAADSVAGPAAAPVTATVAPGRGEAAHPTPGRRRWAGSARSRPSELHPAALRDDRCHTGVPASGGGSAPPTDPPPARGCGLPLSRPDVRPRVQRACGRSGYAAARPGTSAAVMSGRPRAAGPPASGLGRAATCWCGRRWRARCCCAERVAPVARRLGRDRTGRTTTRHVAGGGPRPPTSSRRGFSASLPHSPHRSAGPVVMSSPLPRSHTADRGSTDLASQRATAQEARHPEGGPLPTAPSHRPRTAPQPADRCRHSPVPAVGELLLQGHRHEHHGGPRP